jgi:hypothetical protein
MSTPSKYSFSFKITYCFTMITYVDMVNPNTIIWTCVLIRFDDKFDELIYKAKKSRNLCDFQNLFSHLVSRFPYGQNTPAYWTFNNRLGYSYFTYSVITIFRYTLLFHAREFVAHLLSAWWHFPPRQRRVSHIHAR